MEADGPPISEVVYVLIRMGLTLVWIVGCIKFYRLTRRLRHPLPPVMPYLGTVFLSLVTALSLMDGLHSVLTGPFSVRLLDWAWMLDDILAPVLLLVLLRFISLRDEAFGLIEQLALTDQLTGLPNRRGFALASQAALANARRASRPSAALLLDLDRFKSINDQFGHEAGDRVLVEVANLLRATLRMGDVSLRYGGEEIGAFLPDTDLEEAVAVAERLRLCIREQVQHPGGPPSRITASIGVAPVGPGEAETALHHALISADAALYRAKRDGRDRVERALDTDDPLLS